MQIYLILRLEVSGEGTSVHSACIYEDEAIKMVDSLNREQEKLRQEYINWVDRANESEDEDDLDDEDDMPEIGDYVFIVSKTWLNT